MDYRKLNLLVISVFLVACGHLNHKHNESKREVISTDKSPSAVGAYSQAIKKGNRIYVSGQIGLTIDKQLVEGLEAQTKQAMDNIKTILTTVDLSMNDIVQCQVYLTDIKDYQKMNKIYLGYFTVSPPARAVVAVSAIPRNALIEIMVVAEK